MKYTLDVIYFKKKSISRVRVDHSKTTKGLVLQEDVILNKNASN